MSSSSKSTAMFLSRAVKYHNTATKTAKITTRQLSIRCQSPIQTKKYSTNKRNLSSSSSKPSPQDQKSLSPTAQKFLTTFDKTQSTTNTTYDRTLPDPDYATLHPQTPQNLFTSINTTLSHILSTNPSSILFGEDVAFGGVFRCSQNLLPQHGPRRVFNTPLSENGIAGMAIGYASMGGLAIAEIQFADYIFPAIDQIVNEMAKMRYRSGSQWDCGGVIVRSPCGAVGHGGHYHSQSPEAYLTHTPGLCVVMPRGPRCAKGLLLSAAECKDPVIFLEPKILYRSAVEDVPDEPYKIPLGKAEIIRTGSDVTVVGWGAQLRILEKACNLASQKFGIECELIDLRTLLPWDAETVIQSVEKTGKLVVSHEAPITCGFGAEVVSTIQENCFLSLEAPLKRVCGYDTPFPLVFEKYYVPDEWKNLEAIKEVVEYAR